MDDLKFERTDKITGIRGQVGKNLFLDVRSPRSIPKGS